MEFLNRFMKGLKQRSARSQILSQTARDTGKRSWVPEFGVGEAVTGLFGGLKLLKFHPRHHQIANGFDVPSWDCHAREALLLAGPFGWIRLRLIV